MLITDLVPGVIFVSINLLQPGETMDFFCLDLGTSSTLVKAMAVTRADRRLKTQRVSWDKVKEHFAALFCHQPPQSASCCLSRRWKTPLMAQQNPDLSLRLMRRSNTRLQQTNVVRQHEAEWLLIFCVWVFFFPFRKSFLLETETKMRGSTSASSPSTWKNMRRNYNWPSRAWTKIKMVRCHFIMYHILILKMHKKRKSRNKCLLSTGRIDITEIRQSLADLGLEISKEHAEKILQRYFSLFIYFL